MTVYLTVEPLYGLLYMYMYVPRSDALSNFVQFFLFPVCVVDEDDDDDDESDVSQDSHE